jgi:hypothetical protein
LLVIGVSVVSIVELIAARPDVRIAGERVTPVDGVLELHEGSVISRDRVSLLEMTFVAVDPASATAEVELALLVSKLQLGRFADETGTWLEDEALADAAVVLAFDPFPAPGAALFVPMKGFLGEITIPVADLREDGLPFRSWRGRTKIRVAGTPRRFPNDHYATSLRVTLRPQGAVYHEMTIRAGAPAIIEPGEHLPLRLEVVPGPTLSGWRLHLRDDDSRRYQGVRVVIELARRPAFVAQVWGVVLAIFVVVLLAVLPSRGAGPQAKDARRIDALAIVGLAIAIPPLRSLFSAPALGEPTLLDMVLLLLFAIMMLALTHALLAARGGACEPDG